MADGEVQAFLPAGAPIPAPGPFEVALLKKSVLTFSDYQAALQAAADCIEQRDPGAQVQLVQEPGWSQIYGLSVMMGRASGHVKVHLGLAAGSPTAGSPTGGSTTKGSATSGASSTASPGASTTAPAASPIVPRAVQNLRSTEGYCLAVYSSRVEARWRLMQVLSGPQMTAQRSAFLDCIKGTGIAVPANASNGQMVRIFRDPATFGSLTPSQLQQVNNCTTRYQQYLFSALPPGS